MPLTTADSTFTLQSKTSEATIYLFGATLTSWIVDGAEQIFLSKSAKLDGSKAIRGGVPLVFPHFGTIPTSQLPQHGFARNSKWKWLGIQSETDDMIQVAFELNPSCIDEKFKSLWEHSGSFLLKLVVSLNGTNKTLDMKLVVKNTGSVEWSYTSLLHTYFACKDVRGVLINGLHNSKFVDKVDGGAEKVEDGKSVQIASEVDRVYKNTGDVIEAIGTGVGTGGIKIHKAGFKDCVVWNPWVDKAKAMGDFGDEEFNNMFCVEVGSVSEFVKVSPGQEVEASQLLSLISC